MHEDGQGAGPKAHYKRTNVLNGIMVWLRVFATRSDFVHPVCHRYESAGSRADQFRSSWGRNISNTMHEDFFNKLYQLASLREEVGKI